MNQQARLDELEIQVMDPEPRASSPSVAPASDPMPASVAELAVARAVFDLLKRDDERIDRFVTELDRLRSRGAQSLAPSSAGNFECDPS